MQESCSEGSKEIVIQFQLDLQKLLILLNVGFEFRAIQDGNMVG